MRLNYILVMLCLLSCTGNRQNKKIINNDIKDIIYDTSIETAIKKTPPFEGYLNPLYSLAHLGSEAIPEDYSSAGRISLALKDSLILNDSLILQTEYGRVLFEKSRFDCASHQAFHYRGKDDKLNVYVIGIDCLEYNYTVILNGNSLESHAVGGNIYISPDKKYLITANNYPDPVPHGYYEIYSIEKNAFNFTYLTAIWSDEQYKDILWNGDSLFIKTDNSLYYYVDTGNAIDKSNSMQKENDLFIKDEEWFDIFYFSPFEEGSGSRGNYYIHIKNSGDSEFATSFGDEDFDYDIVPYHANGTLYLISKDEPKILAKMIMVGNDYYVDSKLIKVYSDKVPRTEYGYKLKKGYPEDK